MHVDTGLNFPDVLAFRDRLVAELGVQLIVGVGARGDRPRHGQRGAQRLPQPHPDPGAARRRREARLHRRCSAGARRDEDKARAKERVFSFRDEFGQWDPKNQRPELWDLYNGRIHLGESIRVFPLSNWTELDIWQYIAARADRDPDAVLRLRAGGRRAAGDALRGQRVHPAPARASRCAARSVRYRTVGDANLTAAVPRTATTVEEVIAEIAVTRMTERGATRGDDKVSDAAMEDRKKEGYF